VSIDVVDGDIVFGGTATYDGTIQGSPTIVEGPAGAMDAIMFGGETDLARLGTAGVDTDGAWTIDCYIKTPVPGTGTWHTLTSDREGGHQIIIHTDQSSIGSYDIIGGEGFVDSSYDVNSLAPGWHRLTVKAGEGVSLFYIDGVDVGLQEFVSETNFFAIGNDQNGGRQWGALNRFRLYNGMHTPAEISAASGSSSNNKVTDLIEVDDLRWRVPAIRDIVLDADLRDWDGIPFKAQTNFRPCNKGASAPMKYYSKRSASTTCNFVEFEMFDGGIWNGIEDQASAVALGWTANAVYCGVKVVDDVHQNPGSTTDSSGWNGDSVQIAFTSAARTEVGGINMMLFNYGLHDDGLHTLHHQASRSCLQDETLKSDCTEAAMERFAAVNVTIYELRFPARSLGRDILAVGFQFGFAISINDGDTVGDAQDGQKGWSGWAPYAIQFGNQAENAGLATLVGEIETTHGGGVEVNDMLWSVTRVETQEITIDAVLNDWDKIPFKAQTPFRPCNRINDIGSLSCNWVPNNKNSVGEAELGHAESTEECAKMVLTQCPDATIANMDIIDASAGGNCYCQYGTNMEVR
jgi:hypothetical protein